MRNDTTEAKRLAKIQTILARTALKERPQLLDDLRQIRAQNAEQAKRIRALERERARLIEAHGKKGKAVTRAAMRWHQVSPGSLLALDRACARLLKARKGKK